MKIQVLILFLLSCVAGWGQSTTGAVVGTIADPSAAGVPQVRVVATEQRTNLTAETVSDASGAYAFPALRPGMYRIEAEAAGFRKAVRSGVEVRV
ncbi:MAG: carboxypeptidase regulatory-like domain-containing protein, partial [Bryobacterales bacterium]|nr:carboxypeptidase regulatory-like domain-containing protein [Bryobacterales bacterium]